MGSLAPGVPDHTNDRGYFVPDTTYKSPKNRRVKVVSIGAGFAGILIAYKIQKELENVDLTIYEKNGDVGGTWLENKYPNCACDVPSHSYTYSFALNPWWPEVYSSSDSIWVYLDRVCQVFGLRKYMNFNSHVREARWNEELGRWDLVIERDFGDHIETIRDHCDVLLQATGLLNNPKLPDIPGIDSFKGRKVHTAQWPDDYREKDWAGETVAIIGGGSSSVQTTPGMQPHVKQLHVYLRSRTWLASAQPDNPHGPVFTAEEQDEFARDKSKLVAQARSYEIAVNQVWRAMFKSAPQQKLLRERAAAKMEKHLRKPGLLDALKPNFAVGCRRTTPGLRYMESLNAANVDVHLASVTEVTEDGLVAADGSRVIGLDTIIFATGFDTTYKPHFKIVGRDNVTLAEKFDPNPDSYLSFGVPGFPNYVLFFGPSFPVLAGSVTESLTAVTDLAVSMIRKIQVENLHSVSPKQAAVDQFAEHTQTMLHGTVWEDDCNSWYTRADGRVTAVWPGSALHFQDVVRNPRWEDWDIKYTNKLNMWEYLGRGFTRLEREEGADLAPYLGETGLDDAFYDLKRTPIFKGKPPTAAEARKNCYAKAKTGSAEPMPGSNTV